MAITPKEMSTALVVSSPSTRGGGGGGGGGGGVGVGPSRAVGTVGGPLVGEGGGRSGGVGGVGGGGGASGLGEWFRQRLAASLQICQRITQSGGEAGGEGKGEGDTGGTGGGGGAGGCGGGGAAGGMGGGSVGGTGGGRVGSGGVEGETKLDVCQQRAAVRRLPASPALTSVSVIVQLPALIAEFADALEPSSGEPSDRENGPRLPAASAADVSGGKPSCSVKFPSATPSPSPQSS